ncbi:MAG: Wzz/FepE/Etk N-terminal domain-containing protein, partial [Verrucomicrobiota bacterium]|nr:Wzz/FepE/Etk N-terminal domain-containing protein [Verrucomicrobiota bacterium]
MAEFLMDGNEEAHYSSFNLGDILYALFKHKWAILALGLAGLVAAGCVRFFYTPVYQSHAKLLVRYVLERTPIDPDAQKMANNVIGAEIEILNSWDLSLQVAEALGAKRLLPNAASPSVSDAAGTVAGGLSVFPSGGANIIYVAYQNPDPDLAKLVLEELVNRYFVRHLEVHRSAGAFDFVTQQTDQVHARLNETEDALRSLKMKAGIVSVGDSKAALSMSLNKVEDQLQQTEEELADQETVVKAMEGTAPPSTSDEPKKTAKASVQKDVQRYQAIVGRLNGLRQGELDLLAKYTPENVIVKFHQQQIADLEKQKTAMEEKFPDLTATAPGSPQPTVSSEKARLATVQARAERLRTRLANIKDGMRKMADLESQIADLERNQELEVANYKYFKGTLEKARIDEALDPSKMPNIST